MPPKVDAFASATFMPYPIRSLPPLPAPASLAYRQTPATPNKPPTFKIDDSGPQPSQLLAADARNLKQLCKQLQALSPHQASATNPFSVETVLKDTTLPIDPESSYALAYTLAPGKTVSLHRFIQNNGWQVPRTLDEIANLVATLRQPEPLSPVLGDLAGALSWPVPLRRVDLADETPPATAHTTSNLFVELTRGRSWSAVELVSPRKVIATILASPTAQALGKKMQQRYRGLSTPTSTNDFVLAGLQHSLDKAPSRTSVAGFDLARSEHWGRPAATVVQGLVEHLIEHKLAPPELATVAATLLLAHREPAFLVQDLPDTVTYGSHNWVTFRTAVARIEHQAPGSTASMTYSDIIARGNLAPITAEDAEVERAAQHAGLKDWGVANGLINRNPDDHYSDIEMLRLLEAYNTQLDELNAAVLALATPVPNLAQRALAELKRVYGEHLPLEEKCITLRHSTPSHKGPYSVLDLYRAGKLVISNNAWVSSNAQMPYNAILAGTAKLADIKQLTQTFDTDLKDYFGELKKAITSQVKYMISALPLPDREHIEHADLKLFKLSTVPNRNLAAHKHKDIVDTLLFNVGAPHLNFEVDLAAGRIIARPEFGELVKPDNPYPEFRVPYVKVIPFKPTDDCAHIVHEARTGNIGATDARTDQRGGAVPNSFNSQRTAYVADATLAQIDFEKLASHARGTTTFQTEQTPLKTAHAIVTGLIPFYSAISHFVDGKYGKGSADLILDLLGFMMGAGALTKLGKIAKTTASISSKLLQTARILGRVTISAANPVDGLGDWVKGGIRLAKRGVKQFKRLVPNNHPATFKALTDGQHVAKGTLKTKDGITLQALANYEHSSGQWYHYNAKTRASYGLPIDFNPHAAGLTRKISHSRLLDKLEVIHAKLPGLKGACYESAMKVGLAEGTVTSKTVNAVLDVTTNAKTIGTRYTSAYKDLMGIARHNIKKKFDPALITESGFLNFKRAGDAEPFSHTVYIQRTRTNELVIFNSNDLSLDLAMAGRHQTPVTAGGSQVYGLNESGLANVQKWLDGPPSREFVFTPASALNANALRA